MRHISQFIIETYVKMSLSLFGYKNLNKKRNPKSNKMEIRFHLLQYSNSLDQVTKYRLLQ